MASADGSNLSVARSLIAAYSVGRPSVPRTTSRAQTATTFRVYATGLLSGGTSLIDRRINVNILPDLSALISGWRASDMSASIIPQVPFDISATIGLIFRGDLSLGAVVQAMNFSELGVYIGASVGAGLLATITPIFKDLLALLSAVPHSNLLTFAGGHLPSNVLASIFGVDGVNFSAHIHGMLSGTPQSLGATLTQTGGYVGLPVTIRGPLPSSADIMSSIRVKQASDFPASISSERVLNLSASISHNYASPALYVFIHPIKTVSYDLRTVLRPTRAGTFNLATSIKAFVSTHTSSKPRNIGIFPRPFYRNKYTIGTRSGGFSILTIEPIFGFFPDLAVLITGVPFSRSNLAAKIWPFVAADAAMPTSMVGVTPRININRVRLDYLLFNSLRATATPYGAY